MYLENLRPHNFLLRLSDLYVQIIILQIQNTETNKSNSDDEISTSKIINWAKLWPELKSWKDYWTKSDREDVLGQALHMFSRFLNLQFFFTKFYCFVFLHKVHILTHLLDPNHQNFVDHQVFFLAKFCLLFFQLLKTSFN